MSFFGKVAIVTGAARGIGRATCIQLARQGAKVVVSDFKRDLAAESVAAEIIANAGAIKGYRKVSLDFCCALKVFCQVHQAFLCNGKFLKPQNRSQQILTS